MNEKTKVEGAGALSELFKLLFKGVDKIFDQAVEYENDFGVLKQVTKLPIKKGNEEFTIEIKLAPIKNKEDMFYVEIDDGGSGLDFSKYDKKPMKINKNNRNEFEKLVLQIIKDAGLAYVPEGAQDQYYIDCYDLLEYDDYRMQEASKPSVIKVHVREMNSKEEEGKIDLRIWSDDRDMKIASRFADGQSLKDYTTGVDNTREAIDDVINNVIISSGLMRKQWEDSEDMFDEAMELADIDKEEGTPASSHLDVSLSYIKSSDEVNLSAIYANYDVGQAMEALQQVIDNDEFVATLSEEPQSFRITDEGEDFDIAIIHEVDASNSASDIYTSICALSGMLDAYSINLDTQQQAAADELLTALAKAQTIFQPTDKLDPL